VLVGFTSGYAAGFAGIANSVSYNQRLQIVFIQAASPTATVFSLGYDFTSQGRFPARSSSTTTS
jgi:hypothetical protein